MATGDVSRTKLLAVLREQTEHETLDYKGEFHPDELKAWIELAKDVGAMQIEGGYLVFGADNNGTPTGAVTVDQAKRLDEAAVRGKLRSWIDEPFEIRTAEHVIDGKLLVLMRVEPNQDGFCIFNKDGVYKAHNGKDDLIFRKGEVFARHGSASERWQQPDVDRIKRNLRRRGDEANRAHIMVSVLPLCRLLIDEATLPLLIAGFDSGRASTLSSVKEICRTLNSSNPPPVILNAAPYANWWGYFKYCCGRSMRTVNDAMTLSSFLDPELASLLHRIQGSGLFKQFDDGFVPADPINVWWLADPLWNHLELTRELSAYLARSTETTPPEND